jgi:hypothetical protein
MGVGLMAEILIRAIDNVNPDNELDKGCYKKGHPVAVMDDGHAWGSGETLPDFYILEVPDMTVEQASVYLEEHIDERKRYKFSTGILNALEQSGGRMSRKAENVLASLVDKNG